MNLYEAKELAHLPVQASRPLVNGLLLTGDKVLLVAKPKVGKSILSQQLAHCLAGQHPFLGMGVPTQEPVLYIAGEGDIDELQSNQRNISMSLPVAENKLFYWSLPEHPFDTPPGRKSLMEAAELVRVRSGGYPTLTIFDPAQFLMEGSLVEDKDVRMFLRVVNFYRNLTGSTIWIDHHTHRPIRKPSGELIEEGASAYTGSQAWEAWYKVGLLLKKTEARSLNLSLMSARRPTCLDDERSIEMFMVEPTPLLLVEKSERITRATEAQAVELLRLKGRLTVRQLSETGGKSVSAMETAVERLEKAGMVISEGYPASYSLMKS